MTATMPQTPSAIHWRLLDQVPLTDAEQAFYDDRTRQMLGSLAWQRRKAIELREIMVLARVSGRFKITDVDARGNFYVLVNMDVTVPVKSAGMIEPAITRGCVLAVSYPEEALYSALPGTRFATIMYPGHDIYHPYVHEMQNTLCLGTLISPAFPIKELLFRCYLALCMVGIHLDPGDGAGVLNPRAANWWVQNPQKFPLMTEPFFTADAPGSAK